MPKILEKDADAVREQSAQRGSENPHSFKPTAGFRTCGICGLHRNHKVHDVAAPQDLFEDTLDGFITNPVTNMWAVKRQTRASLEDSLTLLGEALEKLRDASLVDATEVTEQLEMAERAARMVRALVSSELDALIEKIEKSLEARTLEQRRTRLLALTTELEGGSIVHRRAPRASELNQLREQAIQELRAQAGPGGAPRTLPGPEADQWIEWACALKEPEDAESLQTLRKEFAHLDNFIANLEPRMWIAAGSPALEILSEAERSADKLPIETSFVTDPVRHANRPVEPPVTAEALPVTSAAPAITSDIRARVEELFRIKGRMLAAAAAVLVLAVMGAMLWRLHSSHANKVPLKAVETTDLTRSSSETKGHDQSAMPTDSQTHTFGTLQTEKESEPKDQGVSPKAATEVPNSAAPGLLSGVRNRVINILRAIGVVAPPKMISAHNAWVMPEVAQALLVHQVKPQYPLQARQARIEGTVLLHAVIGKDGTVQGVQALSGPLMLMQAAVDAVKQWRYKPYYLNGEPSEFETRIYVNFTL